jgi:hypothetical protein
MCTPYSNRKTRFVETACRVAAQSKVRVAQSAVRMTMLSDCCGRWFAMDVGNELYVSVV